MTKEAFSVEPSAKASGSLLASMSMSMPSATLQPDSTKRTPVTDLRHWDQPGQLLG